MMRADSIMFFWVYFSDLPQSKRRAPGTVSKVAVRGNLMSLALASFWEPVTSAQHWLAYQPGPLALWILIEYWYRQNAAVGSSCRLPPCSLCRTLSPFCLPAPSLHARALLFFVLIQWDHTRLILCKTRLITGFTVSLTFKWIINWAQKYRCA